MSFDRVLFERWLTALRSDQYKQTTGHLRIGDGFCCLGVACDLAGFLWIDQRDHYLALDEDESEECTVEPPMWLQEELGITSLLFNDVELRLSSGKDVLLEANNSISDLLIEMNDCGYSFIDIAEVAEELVNRAL